MKLLQDEVANLPENAVLKIVHHPNGTWTITKVDAEGSYVEGSCMHTMRKRTGPTLQDALNAREEVF